MIYNYIFITLAFLFDGILNAVFPAKFAFDGMYFVPSIGLCALILSIRKMERNDAILLLVLFGMFYDFFYANMPFFYMIFFLLIYVVVQIWSKLVNESIIESLALCVSTIFTKEFMVYLFMRMSGQTSIGISSFLSNRLFLTLIVNAIFVFLLILLAYVKDDMQKRRELRIRREERLPWLH